MNGIPSTLKARPSDSLTVKALARGHHSSLLRYFKKRVSAKRTQKTLSKRFSFV